MAVHGQRHRTFTVVFVSENFDLDFMKVWGPVLNQTVRMDGDMLHQEIGEPTFSAAKTVWNAIS
jgi:hypothetical protein